MNKKELQNIIQKFGGKFTVEELEGITTKGNPENINLAFLSSFLAWRMWHGFSTMVLSAYRPGDTKAHGQGLAIDCVLWNIWKKQTIDIEHLWRIATTWPFWGVGLYFDWDADKTDGVDVIGVHVDFLQTPGKRPLRWIRLNGKYYYQDLKTGLFYNSDLDKTISLKEAITLYEG